jgi:hypothetical protein
VVSSLAFAPGTDRIEVLLRTTIEHARQVTPPDMGTLEEAEGGVMLRRASYRLEWVAYFLLSLDFPVVVVQPPALREIIARMAARAQQIVGEKE